jgi:CDP-diacylglycerol--serine O-phosphatidyltransferase
MANKIVRAIPNAVTCCNLLMGCVATMYAFEGSYTRAFIFIILGGIFDFFDGMIARALHVSSPIGKELDSLADVVTFGVAPAAMVYTLLGDCIATHQDVFASCPAVGRLLPFVAFLMVAFSALRLAMFNLDECQTTSFIGLPTPANALFWGGLCVGSHELLSTNVWGMWAVLAMVALFSWLLIARIPMFSLKFGKGKKNTVVIVFLCIGAVLLVWQLCTKGIVGALSFFSAVIGLYIILSLITQKK